MFTREVVAGCVSSPIGNLKLIAYDQYLVACQPTTESVTSIKHPVLQQTQQQLTAYFAHELQQFTIPLAPRGTLFQRCVWQALQDIPYGSTTSYTAIAKIIDNPKAARAVGMANKSNPLTIIIPCHRVKPANGGIGGYAHGQAVKQWLLNHEANFSFAFSL